MTQSTPPGFREIRAIYDETTIVVYQAYNEEIAASAAAANSFSAPMAAGIWSPSRMTWIKPSAVWMAYRCGWTTLKDQNQARVLALTLSRDGFEKLLMNASLSHSGAEGKCSESPVVVQWDPERVMDPSAEARQVFTQKTPNVRSIQIGLRGKAVQMLLDPNFVLKITDVTPQFRSAAAALKAGDTRTAAEALWPRAQERLMSVPAALAKVLKMETPEAAETGSATPSVAPTLTPSALTADERYERRTCGMHRELLATVRGCVADAPRLRALCDKLLEALLLHTLAPSGAILVAPPIGKPTCVATKGAQPEVVVWLLLDPLDIDSKQTTYVSGAAASDENLSLADLYQSLYKWNPALC